MTPTPYQVTLYTRPQCHLCDDALQLLREFGLDPTIVNIDAPDVPDHIRSDYNECVPVVEIDGKVRFRGRVNRVLLQRMIQA